MGDDDQGEIRTIEVDSRRELGRISYKTSIDILAWNWSGTLLATAWGDGETRIFEGTTGREITHVSTGAKVNEMSFSPDGRFLAIGSGVTDGYDRQGKSVIIESSTGRELGRVAHQGAVGAMMWSHDGRFLASAARDLHVISSELGEEIARFTVDLSETAGPSEDLYGRDRRINLLARNPGNDELAAVASYNGNGRIWPVCSTPQSLR